MTSVQRSGISNAAGVNSLTSGQHHQFASHAPSAVLREIAAVIAAALGLTAGINMLLILLHIPSG